MISINAQINQNSNLKNKRKRKSKRYLIKTYTSTYQENL